MKAVTAILGAVALVLLPVPRRFVCRLVDHDPRWVNATDDGDLVYQCQRCSAPLSKTVA